MLSRTMNNFTKEILDFVSFLLVFRSIFNRLCDITKSIKVYFETDTSAARDHFSDGRFFHFLKILVGSVSKSSSCLIQNLKENNDAASLC